MDITPAFVPANMEGKPLDIEHTITADTNISTLIIYNRACKRLRNPNLWKHISGAMSAQFELWDTLDKEDDRPIQTGDYISIDIPGPGSKAGGGLDWVRVETIEENVISAADESLGITLRSAQNPENPHAGIAHFFNEHATSTFIIQRHGLVVKANYFGRNEVPNTENVSMLDKIRNGLVAMGAIAGLSNLQWAALTKGLLE